MGAGESGCMLVDVCCFDVLVVVLWPVALFWWWVDEWMHVDGCAVDVEVEDVDICSGLVGVWGGLLQMRRMIFLWVLWSG